MKIKKASLVLFFGIFLILSVFVVSPAPAATTQTQSTELIFNSTNFSLVNLTNDSYFNAFIYSYNITSTNNATYNWVIDISQTNGVYTYQYDSLNGTEQLLANTSRFNQVQYNFSFSGTYYVQVYWFTAVGQILSYKEYNAPNIQGLQTNLQTTNNFTYSYWYYWQLSNPSQSSPVRQFKFTFDIYFNEQFNVTLDYNFTISTSSTPSPIVNITGSKAMSGSGNTMRELSLSSNFTNSKNSTGLYYATFQWNDLLISNLSNVSRSISIFFTSSNPPNLVTNPPSTTTYYAPPNNNNYTYVYNNDSNFRITFLLQFLVILSIGAFFFLAYQNKQRYNKQHGYRRSGYNHTTNTARSSVRGSFCTHCGFKYNTNGPYCPNCGEKID